MEGRIPEGFRHEAGGIVSLAKAVTQYRGAINYDLLRQTGHEIRDIGTTISWQALNDFISHSGPDSAIMRELNPDLAEWSNTLKTNTILADIWDQLAQINANLVAMATRKPARKPKQYPRPGKKDQDDTKHYGSGALPKNDLREWMEKKRAELWQKSHKPQ